MAHDAMPHESEPTPRTASATVSPTRILAALLIIGVLALWVLRGFDDRRKPAPQAISYFNMKTIVAALHNYTEQSGALPPTFTLDATGRPLHSWRTLLLAELDHAALYRSIEWSKPWSAAEHADRLPMCPKVFRSGLQNHPSDHTVFLAVAVPGHPLSPDGDFQVSEFPELAADTPVVIEVAPRFSVPWMSPQDADQALLTSDEFLASVPHKAGFIVGFLDGSVRYVQPHELTNLLKRQSLMHK